MTLHELHELADRLGQAWRPTKAEKEAGSREAALALHDRRLGVVNWLESLAPLEAAYVVWGMAMRQSAYSRAGQYIERALCGEEARTIDVMAGLRQLVVKPVGSGAKNNGS